MKIKFLKYPDRENRRKVSGMFYPEESLIIICNTDKWYEQLSTLMHEIGHYIIYKLDRGWRKNNHYIYDVICALIEPGQNKTITIRWLTHYYYPHKKEK